MNFIKDQLAGYGVNEQMTGYLSNIIMVLFIALLSVLANLIAKKIVLKIIIHFISKDRYAWDNIVLEKKCFTSCRIWRQPSSSIILRLSFRYIRLLLKNPP